MMLIGERRLSCKLNEEDSITYFDVLHNTTTNSLNEIVWNQLCHSYPDKTLRTGRNSMMNIRHVYLAV